MSLELALERNTAAKEQNTAALEKLIALLGNAENSPAIAAPAAEDPPKAKRTKKEAAPAAQPGEPETRSTAPETPAASTEESAPSPETTAADAPTTEAVATATEPLTYAQVQAATIGLVKERGRDVAIKVLGSFGAKKADQIPEDKWPDYLAAVEAETEIPF